jgi:hypothetical protein
MSNRRQSKGPHEQDIHAGTLIILEIPQYHMMYGWELGLQVLLPDDAYSDVTVRFASLMYNVQYGY